MPYNTVYPLRVVILVKIEEIRVPALLVDQSDNKIITRLLDTIKDRAVKKWEFDGYK